MGKEWISESTLPYDFYDGAAVVFNNRLHILGSGNSNNYKKHYSWNGSSWREESELPFNFSQGYAVVNDIYTHDYGNFNYLQKYTSITDQILFNNIPDGCTVYMTVSPAMGVYDDDFNLEYDNGTWTTGNDKFYLSPSHAQENLTWSCRINNNTYTIQFTFNYSNHNITMSCVGSNAGVTITNPDYTMFSSVISATYKESDRIHILGSSDTSGGLTSKHYSWDGNQWRNEGTLPYFSCQTAAVNFNNKIYVLGTNYNYNDNIKKYIGIWDGQWSTSFPALPYLFNNGAAVVINNELHLLGGATSSTERLHKYTTPEMGILSWSNSTALPYDFINGAGVIYEGEICLLGGNESGTSKNFYSLANGSWIEREETLPYDFYKGCAVVYDNTLHILGGNASGTSTKHYKLDCCKFLDLKGTEFIANRINERLIKVTSMPNNPSNGDTVIYAGTTNNNYTNGIIYMYNSSTSSWVPKGMIPTIENTAVVFNL